MVNPVKRVLEAYAATFGIYQEFPLPAGAGPVRAIDLAQRLREAGLPAQAYRLAGKIRAAELGFPFIYGCGDEEGAWRLCLPPGADTHGLPEEFLLSGDRALDETIAGEPPVGRRFQLVESELADRAPAIDHEVDVFIFYAATNDKPELFREQLLDELTELLDQARQAGRELIFIDACGLIPEETIRSHQTGRRDERAAFEEVFSGIKRETERISQGHAPYEPNSPLWSELYRFLAERRVRSVLEELGYDLWRRIVDFDNRKLLEKAFTEFLNGFLEEAAQTMLQQMQGFHELNCLERDRRLAQQVERLMEGSSHPLVLIGRELGHYGVLEGLLLDRYSVHSKILGKERLPVLLRQPALEADLLWNIGVRLDEAELELMALRYCLKAIVLRSAVRDLRVTAKLLDSSRIDLLSRDEIEQLIDELHDPTRIYLRSRGQDMVEQLLYLLKDREIIPEEVFEALQGR